MTTSLPTRLHQTKADLAVIPKSFDGEIVTHAVQPLPYPHEVLLTPEGVAIVLNIGRTRVYELLNSEDLRSVKIGKSRRIRRADLDEFIVGLTCHHNGR